MPRAFVETDLAALEPLLERDPFVTLVAVGDGVPSTSHLPVRYRPSLDRLSFRPIP